MAAAAPDSARAHSTRPVLHRVPVTTCHLGPADGGRVAELSCAGVAGHSVLAGWAGPHADRAALRIPRLRTLARPAPRSRIVGPCGYRGPHGCKRACCSQTLPGSLGAL